MGKVSLFVVGQYIEAFNIATGQNLPCGSIYQSTGLQAHIQKRHATELSNLDRISEVIAHPDYVGRNPTEVNSIELVKVFDENILVCIKLDTKAGYLYVSSVYPIRESKLRNRLNSGRLRSIKDFL